MKNENPKFLSTDEVTKILKDAWELSSSPNKDIPLEKLKLSDWNVLEEDIKIVFESGEYSPYKISTYSGEAYYKVVGKSLSKKARAIYTLMLFILIKRGKLGENDKELLHNFQNVRNHFLQIYLLGDDKHTSNEQTFLFSNTQSVEESTERKTKNFQHLKTLTLVSLFLLIGSIAMYYYLKPKPIIQNSDLVDDQNIKLKILHNENGFHPPCDVTLEYDLGSIAHKQAFFSILGNNIPIPDPKGQYIFTFTHPLVTEVELKVDHRVKKILVPINSDGWIALLDNYNVPLNIDAGILHHDINTIPAPILTDGTYYVTYMTINDFGIDGDNMIFETKVKNPKSEGGISCFDIAIDVNGSTNLGKGILSFNLLSKGCERYAKVRVGDLSLPNADLKSLNMSGIDGSDWLVVKAWTKNGILKIFMNDEPLYDLKYTGLIGDVKVMQLGFKGSGSVDWVTVKSHDGNVLYREDFEKVDGDALYSYE